MDLILASTSPYRRQLLERLQLPFVCLPPNVDESPLPGEPPHALATRLALAKAHAVARLRPDALVIGSDQVACLGQLIMGKPGGLPAATEQLRASSGNEVRFYTSIALVCAATGHEEFHVEPFSANFRRLSEDCIATYLAREQPYDCAGSFKCEGLGIALFESLQGNDPTSLEGLPLIALTNMLARAGANVI